MERDTCTGAAWNTFLVKHAAAEAGSVVVEVTNAKSGAPFFLIPQ
jgi:hypothetical protein